MCRLVGYFLAEGSYKKDTGINISFNINETEYINDVCDIIKKEFHLEAKLIKNEESHCCSVCVDSVTLRLFFEDFLNIKRGASNKQIPNFIFHANEKCIISFLYAYFAGDGTGYDNVISVSSVSRKLINEVSYLFNFLGINGRICHTKDSYLLESNFLKNCQRIKHNHTIYKFTLCNVTLLKSGELLKDNVKYTKPDKTLSFEIERYSKRYKKIINYKCVNYTKLFENEFLNNEKLNKFVNSDLMLIKIKDIKEVKPNYEYVYDFCVAETENFVGGFQPICLHNSTIEGGFVSTDDEEIYNILLSIRSHGWDRDFSLDKQYEIRTLHNVSDFRALYTFYYPGFNLRSTDLQAFLGINQLDRLDSFINKRNENFKIYQNEIKNDFWKIKEFDNVFVSNFSYPIITKNLDKVVKELTENNVEIRPLVCGSISRQPFWEKIYGKSKFEFADIVHDYGMYVPNNHDISKDEILLICDILNKNL